MLLMASFTIWNTVYIIKRYVQRRLLKDICLHSSLKTKVFICFFFLLQLFEYPLCKYIDYVSIYVAKRYLDPIQLLSCENLGPYPCFICFLVYILVEKMLIYLIHKLKEAWLYVKLIVRVIWSSFYDKSCRISSCCWINFLFNLKNILVSSS